MKAKGEHILIERVSFHFKGLKNARRKKYPKLEFSSMRKKKAQKVGSPDLLTFEYIT